MPERGFLIFWIFLQFFSEFSYLGRVRTEFWTKFFFSLFLGLSHPVLDKNNAEKRFFNFSNYFAIFFWNFLAWVEYERNSGLKFFFFSFSVYLIPFWVKILPERGFLIFWIFFLFLSEFSCPGRVCTEFGSKFFFSLSRSISSSFG